MKRSVPVLALLIFACVFASGQASDDYKKFEVFAGYSNNLVESPFDEEDPLGDSSLSRSSFHGFNTSAVVNLNRYIGLKADVSGNYKNRNFNFSTPEGAIRFDTDESLYNFLGGVQIKNNSVDKKFKPFVHALVGAGHLRVKVDNVSCPTGLDCGFITGRESTTGFAGAFGGGIDIKVNDHIDFRLVQVDYNPVRIEGMTQQNVRFGIGLVFR
ncbi:MAG TPA: outer membrane beta-barrel protein [Pyrinomonadaceae bacterium]|nr:outer membrane beta-barrel protein [Pyrinomonadaceae bacterium]